MIYLFLKNHTHNTHNKFNSEWRKPPINFLDVNMSIEIFKTFVFNKYTIVYIRPKNKHIVNDNSATYNLHDYELLGKYNIIDGTSYMNKQKKNIILKTLIIFS